MQYMRYVDTRISLYGRKINAKPQVIWIVWLHNDEKIHFEGK